VNQYDELSWRQLGGVLSAKGDFRGQRRITEALLSSPGCGGKTGLAIV